MGLSTLNTQAALDVLAERQRQIDAEGFDLAHDDAHGRGEMTKAAASYCVHASVRLDLEARGEDPVCIEVMAREAQVPRTWPWASHWWKPASARQCLVKAAALLIAEIERIDRKAARRTP